jgi:hypothetical protein
MGDIAIRDKGKKFSSTYQPRHNGRKPKIYTIAKKENNKLGLEEYKETLMYLINTTTEEKQQLMADPKTPCWIMCVCNALLKDIEKGSTYTLQSIIERLFGKAGTSVDVTSKGKEITHEPITVEIIDKREQVEKDNETAN